MCTSAASFWGWIILCLLGQFNLKPDAWPGKETYTVDTLSLVLWAEENVIYCYNNLFFLLMWASSLEHFTHFVSGVWWKSGPGSQSCLAVRFLRYEIEKGLRAVWGQGQIPKNIPKLWEVSPLLERPIKRPRLTISTIFPHLLCCLMMIYILLLCVNQLLNIIWPIFRMLSYKIVSFTKLIVITWFSF